MKTLIFADAHIDQHKKSQDRLQHCLKVLEWIFDTAIKNNISHIICAGDLFHQRQKIDVLSYQKTFEIFYEKVRNGLTIDLLLGNHDLWHFEKWDISSVNPLKAIQGVSIIDKPCVKYRGGFPISYLPYTHNPAQDILGIDRHDLLIAHVAIDGALWNVKYKTYAEVSIESDGEMVKVGPEVFKDFKQVFMGHYHAAQKLTDTVEYVGSPLELSFGEAFQDKHIIIYDLETYEKEYVVNDFSPKHYIIPEKDIDKYSLENNFVQVLVDDISSVSMVDIRKDMVEKRKVSSLEIIESKVKKDETHLVVDAKSILYKGDEMLKSYIDEMKKAGATDLPEEKLFELGKTICGAVSG